MSTDALPADYETLMRRADGDVLAPHQDQLPARRPVAAQPATAAGPGADLAAMAGPLLSLGLARAPLSEMFVEARRIGMQMGAKAYYRFPAGGQNVEGASIRAAEELAQLWGYCITAVQIQDIRDGRVWLRGVAGDALTMRLHTEDRVYTLSAPSGGFAKSEEQRDRWQTMQIASGGSKALRSAILRLIPARLVFECVQAAKDAKQPPNGVDFQTLCNALVAQFEKSKSKITLAELEQVAGVQRLQWRVAEWRTLDDLMEALKHGETTVEEVWPDRVKGNGSRAPAPLPPVATPTPTAAPVPVQATVEAPKASAVPTPSAAALKSLEQGFPEVATQARADLGLNLTVPASSFTSEQRLELARRIEQSKHPEDRVWG